MPETIWPLLHKQELQKQELQGQEPAPLQDYITDRYFSLIRNFNRFSWLLVYLFGASPAVCKTFVGDHPHNLQLLNNGTLYLPYATSLRMGDLGYQSDAQRNLDICYNSLEDYVHTLSFAITEPHDDYEAFGIKVDGEYQQLSTALLQIENEFYSAIRPKRVSHSGETALCALQNSGVEYIEVRCVDVNPFLPLGIDAEQIRFMDCFLLHCLFSDSPPCDVDDRQRISANLRKVVNEGRRPGLTLNRRDGEMDLQRWGLHLLEQMEQIAMLLDQANGGNDYQQACKNQRNKLLDSSLTPSAQILAELEQGGSFYAFAMGQAHLHQQHFVKQPLSPEKAQAMSEQSTRSLQQQLEIEASDKLSFDEYLQQYFDQYQRL